MVVRRKHRTSHYSRPSRHDGARWHAMAVGRLATWSPVKLNVPISPLRNVPSAWGARAEYRFTVGIDVVVDVENLPAEIPLLIEKLCQAFEALAGFRGHAQYGHAGVLLLNELHQLVCLRAR